MSWPSLISIPEVVRKFFVSHPRLHFFENICWHWSLLTKCLAITLTMAVCSEFTMGNRKPTTQQYCVCPSLGTKSDWGNSYPTRVQRATRCLPNAPKTAKLLQSGLTVGVEVAISWSVKWKMKTASLVVTSNKVIHQVLQSRDESLRENPKNGKLLAWFGLNRICSFWTCDT